MLRIASRLSATEFDLACMGRQDGSMPMATIRMVKRRYALLMTNPLGLNVWAKLMGVCRHYRDIRYKWAGLCNLEYGNFVWNRNQQLINHQSHDFSCAKILLLSYANLFNNQFSSAYWHDSSPRQMNHTECRERQQRLVFRLFHSCCNGVEPCPYTGSTEGRRSQAWINIVFLSWGRGTVVRSS